MEKMKMLAGSIDSDFGSHLEIENMETVKKTGLGVRDGKFVATNYDPYIEVRPFAGVRHFAVDIRYEEGYVGDFFRIYYMFDDGDYYSESKTIEVSEYESFFTKVVEFERPVIRLRIDPCENAEETGVRQIRMCACSGREEAYASLYDDILPEGSGSLKQKTIVCAHELSNTGAPMLAFNIAKRMREEGVDVLPMVASHGSGELAKRFHDEGMKLLDARSLFFPNRPIEVAGDEIMPGLLVLRKKGYKIAYLNSLSAAQLSIYFKAVDMQVISLIHETEESIETAMLHSMASSASKFSDVMVFPSSQVEEGFRRVAEGIPGESFVRSQGVYLAVQEVDGKEIEALHRMLEDLGINEESKVVLSAGSINLRKGYDLFVAAASELQKQIGDSLDVHFVWAGDTLTKRDEDEYLKRLNFQVRKSGIKLHQLSYVRPPMYRLLLQRANVFWSTARDDTFPSVILEALFLGIPAIAFKGSGGADIMLEEGRGYLAEGFTPSNLAALTEYVFENEEAASDAASKGRRWIEESLDFRAYVEFLVALSREDQRVNPKEARNLLAQDYATLDGNSIESAHRTLQRYSDLKLKRLIKSSRGKRRQHADAAHASLLDFSSSDWARSNSISLDSCLSMLIDFFGGSGGVAFAKDIAGKTPIASKEFKFACGNNLLRASYLNEREWAFPPNPERLQNICFVGAGIDVAESPMSLSGEMPDLFRLLFDAKYVHSVRDSYTQNELRAIGIENTIVTGDPSLWAIADLDFARVPNEKAKRVVTVVNSYRFKFGLDLKMLKLLCEKYEEVLVWPQGRRDYELFFSSLTRPMCFEFLEPTLASLDEALSDPDAEYVGAGIECGLRALAHGRRAIFAASNEVAKAVCEDANLPYAMEDDSASLEHLIDGKWEADIIVPIDAIGEWKRQFSK